MEEGEHHGRVQTKGRKKKKERKGLPFESLRDKKKKKKTNCPQVPSCGTGGKEEKGGGGEGGKA